jgi:hypothetical protein
LAFTSITTEAQRRAGGYCWFVVRKKYGWLAGADLVWEKNTVMIWCERKILLDGCSRTKWNTTSVPNCSSFDFFTLSLTTRLIKKFVQTLPNLSHSWRSCIDKATHNKRTDILHTFLNNTSSQTWVKKIKQTREHMCDTSGV